MKMNKLLTGLALTSTLLTFGMTSASAHESRHSECEVSLNYDIVVEPQKLVFTSEDKELYRVEFGKLFIEGDEVELNGEQSKLLTQYSDQVSAQVPEVIEIVNQAVEMASQAVSMALTPLLGDESGAKLDELMVGVSKRVESVAYQQGDRFYLGATENSLEDTFNKEFEQEIEALVQNSLGSMMMALGSQMMSSEGGSFEEKMESFGRKMESIGDDIEQQMSLQAESLEERAESLCDNFQQLLVTEQQLKAAIPELSSLSLAQSNLSAKKG